MAKPTTSTKDDRLKVKDADELKTALEKLGLKTGDLENEVKVDLKRGDLVTAIIALCKSAPKKK